MAFQTWQVGLDIQNGQLCALGIQRRRDGWQLRHWWQHALPHDTLTHGLLQRPETVITLLRYWRKRLPYRVSLRVGFPPQLVLQRSIEPPPRQLREPERSGYIMAAARRFFPIDPQTLALDYRQSNLPDNQLWLTATRQEALHSWLNCFEAAHLTPEVLELTPAALFAMANSLRLDPEAVLVHGLHDHWLWLDPMQPQGWGWCARQEVPDFSSLRQQHLPDISSCYYSSCGDQTLPEGVQWLNPLDAFAMKQPPLPVRPGVFTLAAGLALRPGDS